MPNSGKSSFAYRDSSVPVQIFVERRNNIRMAFGKKGLLVRFPVGLRRTKIEKELTKIYSWARKQLDENDSLRQRYISEGYRSGDTIEVRGQTFEILITENSHRTATSKAQMYLKPKPVIAITLPTGWDHHTKRKSIRTLLSRSLARHYRKEITERVHHFNQLYYQETIGDVKLKYMSSRWGSCSSLRNINLSTRLLLAPSEVLDYTIIHELSHLKEMNHSPQFWAWVTKGDPSYKKKEEWLRVNGHTCDFK